MTKAITITDNQFTLTGPNLTYSFHVDEDGDLIHDHFGERISEIIPVNNGAEVDLGPRRLREFPDIGRGDFRLPAFHIRQNDGCTVSHFKYASHEVVLGKPKLPGLPATFGEKEDVETVLVHLKNEYSNLSAILSYSIFPKHNAIARSFQLRNDGSDLVVLEQAASFSVDLPSDDMEFVQLCGDWAREAHEVRRKVNSGTQGFQSVAGYSSAFHNPFVALVHPSTTETTGQAIGFNLIYTGSHSTQIEKHSHGNVRILMGMNPLHLSWPLAQGETFTTPECVAVFSNQGLGGMSRHFHDLYRNHLIRSKWVDQNRPTLLNNWEATYFDFTQESLYDIAEKADELGVKLFVMDDGWFANKYPRSSDTVGLGDWEVNREKFPNGLKPFVDKVTALGKGKMMMGIWVEMEMVSPKSELYKSHPDWVLHAGKHTRTEQRHQLILNLGLPEVQSFIIDTVTSILNSANIKYVKWDNNRMMHELPHPSAAHRYMLGMYHVYETLITRFPDVLFEGCASGGGRFDPGILHYFPQIWTSDDADALERLYIQFGTSIPYPASTISCHVAAVPSHQTHRITPFEFRAHVAMMGGSFGFELDLSKLTTTEQETIPALIALSEKINPLVINGDMYKLASPYTSNWPAVQYVSKNGSEAVVLAYQIRHVIKSAFPALCLQGLDKEAMYKVEGKEYSGATLMGTGMKWSWEEDYQSRVVFVTRI